MPLSSSVERQYRLQVSMVYEKQGEMYVSIPYNNNNLAYFLLTKKKKKKKKENGVITVLLVNISVCVLFVRWQSPDRMTPEDRFSV
jgi:hypothetical protein